MPKDISAAASPAWAMIRVGCCSAVTTLPDPSVNDQGPELAAGSAVSVVVPQAASRMLIAAPTRIARAARLMKVAPFRVVR